MTAGNGMQAAVLRGFNPPWELTELPKPEPSPGQVLLRVAASGVCGTDVHLHHGVLPVELPLAAGHEPVGEIVATGSGVTDLAVGDRVGVAWTQKGGGRCRFCHERRPRFCRDAQSWLGLGGGNAELMLAWAEGCTLLPDGLSYEEAAPLFCAGYTALSALRKAEPRPGARVAVVGIGGLGHLAVQYAKALGHEVVAVTGSDDKAGQVAEPGAEHVVRPDGHVGEALMAAGGADVIVCMTNSAAHVSQALAGLLPEGRLVNVGALDGPIEVDGVGLFQAERGLLGSIQGDRRHLVDALELAASGKVRAHVEVYRLAAVNEVLERLAAGQVRYRAVLTPA